MVKTISINVLVSLLACLALEGLVRAFIPVRNVGPAFAEYDPYYGKRFKQNFSTLRVSSEFRMRFSTNSLRQRGPQVTRPVTGGVLFLGDSYTEGYGVSDGDEYAALVRKELERQHGERAPWVLNTGMSDTGNGRSLKILLHEAKQWAPKLVVLQLMNNDFGDNLREKHFGLEGGDLRELPVPVPGKPGRFSVHQIVETVPGLAHSYAISALRQIRWSSSAQQFYAPSTAGDELTYKLWARIFQVCAEQRWPLVLLAVDLKPDRLARLRAMAGSIPVVVTPVAAERRELFFAADGHWNERGHREVADALLRAMQAAGVSFETQQNGAVRLPVGWGSRGGAGLLTATRY